MARILNKDHILKNYTKGIMFDVILTWVYALNLASIKFKATLYICTLIIVTADHFRFFSFQNTRISLLKQYNNEAQLVLSNTMLAFSEDFNRVETILMYLIQNEEIKEAGISHKDYSILEITQKAIPHSNALHLGMEDGSYLDVPNAKMPPSYDPRDRQWYHLAKQFQGKIVWSDPYLSYLNQRIIITAAGELDCERFRRGNRR
jgi:methyl-accepting chemotaxis protein